MPNRKLNRLSSFDYSTAGAYFITMCVQDRACVFGEIVNDEMRCNTAGEIVREQWEWIGQHYPYVVLDECVVMPNHFHGIIFIDPNREYANDDSVSAVAVGTGRDLSLHDAPGQQARKIKSLSQLVGAFKTTSSKQIHLQTSLAGFRWQRSFHDRIIRSEAELNQISDYILHNPKNWPQDSEFKTLKNDRRDLV